MGEGDDDDTSLNDQGAGKGNVTPEGRRFLGLLSARRLQAESGAVAGDDGDTTTQGYVSLPVPQPSPQDLADIRARFDLSDDNTIAAAGTNIPALQGAPFIGMSRALRDAAGLDDLDEAYGEDRPIKSTNPAYIASGHAEEDVLNLFHKEITEADLSDEELDGAVINMLISNAGGICKTCFGGFGFGKYKDGVIKQFSDLHPNVTIRIAADGGDAFQGKIRVDGQVVDKSRKVVTVRGGVLVDA